MEDVCGHFDLLGQLPARRLRTVVLGEKYH
jgi:hypothetical protein